MTHAANRLPIYVAFGCSGAAALIYETAWTRLLGLSLGHTLAAASVVLAAFMGGLALGAGVVGRLAPRLERAAALRRYVQLEVLIAVLAQSVPLEMAVLRPVLAMAYGDGDSGLAFGLARLACAAIVVTLPAIAMGATLPLLVRWMNGSAAAAPGDTARLYAANAMGATVGAIVSGFVLLPTLGLAITMGIGAVLNVLSALIGWRMRTASDDPAPARAARPPAVPAIPRGRVVAAFAVAISGAASLVLQLAWTRILALVVGPTTYAFSAMVATFIAGIAMGSLAGGWLGRRGPTPTALAGSLLLCGAAALGAAAWAPGIAMAVAHAVAAPDASFAGVMWLQSLLIGAAMLPMTVAFGAAFPLAVGLVVRDDRAIVTDVAVVYTANTLGAIAGALAGGFVLIPRLGLQGSVKAAAVMVMVGAVIVVIMTAGRRRVTVAVAAVAVTVAMWFTPSWDRALLSSGAYKYAAYLPAEHRDVLLRAGSLLYYAEGAASTVSVRRLAGSVSLAIDGKIDASNAGDMLTQRLLAHMPLLLHPAPREVAIVGLGSGVTLGSALTHPIVRAESIEISREVVEASAHFVRENGQALEDPRSRLIVGDGRSHLMLGRRLYDVVISEPSNPWIAGVAGLFTREMFEAIRDRLAPGGLVCQWAHAYDMSEADLRSIVATFTGVFPHALLWRVGEGDVLLVGSRDPLDPRLPQVRAAWTRPGVAGDLATVSVSGPDVLLSLAIANETGLHAFAAGAAIQTDDRLALEFTGPHSLYGRGARDGLAALDAFEAQVEAPAFIREIRQSPAHRRDRGLMLLGAEAFAPAAVELFEAVTRDPADAVAIDALIRAAGPAGRLEEVERRLRMIVTDGTTPRAAAVGVSRLLASRGEFTEAAAMLQPFADARTDIAVFEQLASVFADAGDPNQLSAIVAGLRSIAPDSEPASYFSATLALMTGRPHEVLRIVGALRARGSARVLAVEAAANAALGRHADARRAFEAAIAADPRNAARYESLAAFEAAGGRYQAAAAAFAEALILDPSSTAAREGLAGAIRRLR